MIKHRHLGKYRTVRGVVKRKPLHPVRRAMTTTYDEYTDIQDKLRTAFRELKRNQEEAKKLEKEYVDKHIDRQKDVNFLMIDAYTPEEVRLLKQVIPKIIDERPELIKGFVPMGKFTPKFIKELKAESDNKEVKRLMDMGFSEEEARRYLK